MHNNFIQISHDIIRHPSVITAPIAQRWVLITILDRLCWDSCKQDDHGVIIDLQRNQLMFTIRQLAEWANVDKNDAERALARFSKCQILRQEVRHRKTIVTLLQGIISYNSETNNETKVRQERDIKEYKQEKQEDKLIDMIDRAREKDDSDLVVFSHRTKNTIALSRKAIHAKLSNEADLLAKPEEIENAILRLKKQNANLTGDGYNYLKTTIKNMRKETYVRPAKRVRNEDPVERSREALSKSSCSWQPKN